MSTEYNNYWNSNRYGEEYGKILKGLKYKQTIFKISFSEVYIYEVVFSKLKQI